MATDFMLVSPLDGWAAPLSEVPDPVFAEAMMGDGIAIDPTGGVLSAPCDGVILSLHAARHALTLRTSGGIEILMHIGLDTVALGGEGFEAHVAQGQGVRAGDALISFDLDLLARRARSLLSPIVVTSGQPIRLRVSGQAVRRGDPLLGLGEGAGSAADPRPDAPVATVRRPIQITLRHGLHARPAARLADIAKRLEAQVSLDTAARAANVRSPVALMALGLKHGDHATLSASGPDAEAAVAALAELIESGMGEGAPVPCASVAAPVLAPVDPAGPFRGVMASPGLAVGRAARLIRAEIVVAEAGAGIAAERAALAEGLAAVRSAITGEMARDGAAARQTILAAHLAFVDDPELADQAERSIAAGKSAAFAWRAAVGGYVEALRGLGDRRIAERVDDLLDLERRVLMALAGEDEVAPVLPQGAILIADDLLPSQLMGLDPGRIAGLCTAGGGPTSHVAILAQAMGVPALVAAGPGVLALAEGTSLILDAEAGLLQASPGAAALEAAQSRIAQRTERRGAARAKARDAARMSDGAAVAVMANLGAVAEAGLALPAGADGCGLLRTEFLFLDREAAPDEDEQARQYQAVADALDGRPLIVRLLDVGGDKTAAYLPIAAEDNPALGVRGVRVALRRPHLLRTQLRAILRVAPVGQCRIMVPMVARLSELRAVRAALDEARRDLGVTGRVDLGVMIETPAAAMIADQLAAECDFLSIGTNDLTQYALAMDRGNPELAAELDALDPAVLRLIARTVEGGLAHALSTGVCGGAAGDLAAIPILIGLGVDKLSMSAAAIPEAKALIRTLSAEACRKLAAQALGQPSAEAVRALSGAFLNGDA
jgi:phosphocarrier protein FPr/phosphocarrier protein